MKRNWFALLGLCTAFHTLADPALSGEFVQGGLITGQAEPGSKVWLDDKELRLSPSGAFVFGFGRDAGQAYRLSYQTKNGVETSRQLTVKPRQYRIQKVEGIKKSIMQPKTEDIKHIHSDLKATRKARKVDSDLSAFKMDFIWPAKGRISGVYGSQRFYNGKPGRPHYGLDIAAPVGATVIAPASGTVLLTKRMFYSGNTILLDHGYGISSSFLHLSKISVSQGQKIHQGDKIGEIGATGRVTGSHLDWRLNWFNTRLDPQLLLKGKPE